MAYHAASSFVVDNLTSDVLADRSSSGNLVGLAYFYYDYQNQKQHSTLGTTKALVRQLAAQLPKLPDELENLYNASTKGLGTSLGISDAKSLLSRTCRDFQKLYICIDGLDECEDQVGILDVLKELPKHVRILITGRENVRDLVRRLFETVDLLKVRATTKDIMAFIQRTIQQNRKKDPELMDDDLEMEIANQLASSSHGV